MPGCDGVRFQAVSCGSPDLLHCPREYERTPPRWFMEISMQPIRAVPLAVNTPSSVGICQDDSVAKHSDIDCSSGSAGGRSNLRHWAGASHLFFQKKQSSQILFECITIYYYSATCKDSTIGACRSLKRMKGVSNPWSRSFTHPAYPLRGLQVGTISLRITFSDVRSLQPVNRSTDRLPPATSSSLHSLGI